MNYIEQELFPIGYVRLEAERLADGTWRVSCMKGERWRLVNDLDSYVAEHLAPDEATDVIAAILDGLQLQRD